MLGNNWGRRARMEIATDDKNDPPFVMRLCWGQRAPIPALVNRHWAQRFHSARVELSLASACAAGR